MQSFKSEYAIEGLKAFGSANPKVKVVYLKRNPLDRKISNLRHDFIGKQQAHERLPAHCKIGDVDCKKPHASVASLGVTLPIGDNLTAWLNSDAEQDATIQTTLRKTFVEYVQVSYEKLYSSDNYDEWMKIFRLLRTKT